MPVTKKNRLNRASKAHNKTIRTSKSKRRRNSKKKSIRTSKGKRSKKRSSRKKSKRSSRKKSKKGNSHVMKGGDNKNLDQSDISKIKANNNTIKAYDKIITFKNSINNETVIIFIKGFAGDLDIYTKDESKQIGIKYDEHIILEIEKIPKNKNILLVWDGDAIHEKKFTNIIYKILLKFPKIKAYGFKIDDEFKTDQEKDVKKYLKEGINYQADNAVDKQRVKTLSFIKSKLDQTQVERLCSQITYIRLTLDKDTKKIGASDHKKNLEPSDISRVSQFGYSAKYFHLASYIYSTILETQHFKSFNSGNSRFIFYGGGGIASEEIKKLITEQSDGVQKKLTPEGCVFYYPISRNKIEMFPTAGDYFISNLPQSIVHSVDGISNPSAILAYSSNIHKEFMSMYFKTKGITIDQTRQSSVPKQDFKPYRHSGTRGE